MDRQPAHPEREDDVALLQAFQAPASEQVGERVQGDRVGVERRRLAPTQEAGERTHGDRPRDSLLAHRSDFGQGLHGRAVEQPLLAIQSLGRELAGAGMSQIEHRGSNRLGRLIGEPDGALIDQASLGRGKGFVSLRMMEGNANAARISRGALATDDQHPTATVRDPLVGADIEQALEHEPGRNEQGASLGENLGHHAERQDRQPFP